MIRRLFRPRVEPRLAVLMVCMGNICRSPTAHGVLRARLQREGMGELVQVDSAGTIGFHRGSPPDPRAIAHAARRGIDIADLRAREVTAADFDRFDLLLAMDEDNLDALRRRAPPERHDRLRLLLSFAPARTGVREVPDPYFGAPAGFELVLDLVEAATDGLLAELRQRLADSAEQSRQNQST
jgi:protein-tyrosine phosphatase